MFIQSIKPNKYYIPHKCYIFSQNERWFAVDLDKGLTVAITPCMKAILEKCAGCTASQIYDSLADMFSQRDTVKEIIKLEQYANLGILVNRLEGIRKPRMNPTENSSNRFKIFIVPDWSAYGVEHGIEHRYVLESRYAEYQLLTTLAKYVDVCVAVPNDLMEKTFFEEPGIYPVPIASDKAYTSSQAIKPDYSAVLSLSTNIFRTLTFYSNCSNNKRIPVIRWIQSEPFRRSLVESAMIAYSLMSPYDAIVTDSHWWKHYLYESFPKKHIVEVFLDGVNTETFRPIDKLKCRQILARALQQEDIKTNIRFIGLAMDMYSPSRLNIAFETAKRYLDCLFLVFVPGLSENVSSPYSNLILFRDMVGFQPDSESLPVIFNALDIMLFQEIPEHSHSFLLQAWACGLPVLRTSIYPSDSTWPGWFLQQDKTHPLLQTTSQLMEQANELLDNPTIMAETGLASRKFSESCTWDQTALQYIDLVKRIHLIAQQPLQKPLEHSAISFLQQFDHINRRPEPTAFLSSGLPDDEINVLLGVALSLALTHTPTEIHGILSQLCSNHNEVNKILNIVDDLGWGNHDDL